MRGFLVFVVGGPGGPGRRGDGAEAGAAAEATGSTGNTTGVTTLIAGAAEGTTGGVLADATTEARAPGFDAPDDEDANQATAAISSAPPLAPAIIPLRDRLEPPGVAGP